MVSARKNAKQTGIEFGGRTEGRKGEEEGRQRRNAERKQGSGASMLFFVFFALVYHFVSIYCFYDSMFAHKVVAVRKQET